MEGGKDTADSILWCGEGTAQETGICLSVTEMFILTIYKLTKTFCGSFKGSQIPDFACPLNFCIFTFHGYPTSHTHKTQPQNKNKTFMAHR